MRFRNTAGAIALSFLAMGQTFLIGTFTTTAAEILLTSKAYSKDAKEIAEIAKAVTVRIEGVQGGSGVLIKQQGNRYTVLTAWHCVSDIRKGDEVDIQTEDGEWHLVEEGSIKRIEKVDLAILTFSSSNSYRTASLGKVDNVQMGSPIFVTGFPLPSSSIPERLLRFLKGDVVANSTVFIPDGYQLLYNNPTLAGMSGGSVLNDDGELVGIHGRAEKNDAVSMSTGKAVATGINQSVPISYYQQFANGEKINISSQAKTVDDFIAQAKSILGEGKEKEVIRLATNSIRIKPTASGYYLRAYEKDNLKDHEGALKDINSSLNLDPYNSNALIVRGIIKYNLKDFHGSIKDYEKSLKIDPNNDLTYSNMGAAKDKIGDINGALKDLNKAVKINPKNTTALYNLGYIKVNNGYISKGLQDLEKVIVLDPKDKKPYFKIGRTYYMEGSYQTAIKYLNDAIKIDPKYKIAYNIRALTKNELGDHQGALSDYDKNIEIHPNDPNLYKDRCYLKIYSLKDYYGAIADCSKAIEIDKNHDGAYVNRAVSKKLLGDYQGSIDDYKKAINIDPNFAGNYFQIALIKGKYLKDYYGSISDFTKAIELDPNNADNYFNRGFTKKLLRDYDGAFNDLNKAITINSNYINAYEHLSDIKNKQGDYRGSCYYLKKGASLNSNSHLANFLNSADGAWCRNMR